MFLQKLNNEEAKNYLELAQLIALSDGCFSDREKHLMSIIRGDLHLHDYEIKDVDFQTVLDFFNKKNEEVRKIIFFESLVMAFIDGKFVKEEIEIIQKIQKSLKIEEELKESIKIWLSSSLIEWLMHSEKLNKEGSELLGIPL